MPIVQFVNTSARIEGGFSEAFTGAKDLLARTGNRKHLFEQADHPASCPSYLSYPRIIRSISDAFLAFQCRSRSTSTPRTLTARSSLKLE